MKIGIIVAMGKELDLLLPLLSDTSAVTINNFTFHKGKAGRHEIVALQSGIGKVNAAVATLTLIENFHPALVMNTGVAGGTGNGASILDVVIGTRIAYHDCWCGPGTEWGEAAGCPRYFESVAEIADLPFLAENKRVKKGLIASGDIFVSRPEDVTRIKTLFPDVMAVDMESAAIAQVCNIKSVPFFCLRVVSDTPGADDNIAQYENFWSDAPRETFEILQEILKNI
ncbi:MAG: 5'-methylthioadenosine/adenosylhomocysteine nucleosidase [Muribaculaceae bacterium]|nr:5'-methylthioadenosine/adenosylhomocysteine nucleosidase [Muribaculaceae bacterium]MDE6809655.1 5'-methylthioadenosine/adenosylhomocysteine nucleosidase [Muribaculaceae bacterium]